MINCKQPQWGSASMIYMQQGKRNFIWQQQDKFVRALAEDSFLPMKEVLECGEFFHRVRKHTRNKVIADLCCGHGLLGILFAMFERKVEKVILVDKVTPPSRQKLIDCANRVAPWVADKIVNVESRIKVDADWLDPGCAVVSAHACGKLSDLCIDIAIDNKSSLAILPCCYPRGACKAPQALQTTLGFETAFDVDRTYRLESADYHVRWSEIPKDITPMNRVICGKRK